MRLRCMAARGTLAFVCAHNFRVPIYSTVVFLAGSNYALVCKYECDFMCYLWPPEIPFEQMPNLAPSE